MLRPEVLKPEQVHQRDVQRAVPPEKSPLAGREAATSRFARTELPSAGTHHNLPGWTTGLVVARKTPQTLTKPSQSSSTGGCFDIAQFSKTPCPRFSRGLPSPRTNPLPGKIISRAKPQPYPPRVHLHPHLPEDGVQALKVPHQECFPVSHRKINPRAQTELADGELYTTGQGERTRSGR